MTLNRTALVTGASRGLGLETCRQLLGRGFRVLLTSRGDDGRNAAKRLGVEHHPLDVTDPKSVEVLARDLERGHQSIDVLVNNAGIAMKGFDEQVARETLEVNFFGAMRVTDAILPRVPEGGNVVMVSSGMGELSGVGTALREKLLDPKLDREGLVSLMRSFIDDVARDLHTESGWPSSAYRVSKVGLNALARILARELAPRRIRVNAVCPGWVRTDMGGSYAERDVATGAASIVWAAALDEDEAPTGGFFRDGHRIDW